MRWWKLYIVILLFFVVFNSHGQSMQSHYECNNITERSIQFNFRCNSDELVHDYRNNQELLGKLNNILTNKDIVAHLDSIKIISSASPDGAKQYNIDLARRRGYQIKNYLTNYYNDIDSNRIEVLISTADWDNIRALIEEDNNFLYKTIALDAITDQASDATIEWRLRRMVNGDVWRYITKNYFWRYTAATSLVYYLDVSDKPFELSQSADSVLSIIDGYDKSSGVSEVSVLLIDNDTMAEEIIDNPINAMYGVASENVDYDRKPLFALKTNLLFDVLSLVNIELEVPIGKHWSMAGEWMFPWWVMDNDRANSSRSRIQILNGNLEARYWFGNRTDRLKMTGWFAGIYCGGGLYDIEHRAKGYQGEFFIMGGISGGFVHTINMSGSLRMEYSLGVGYMQTNYRHYKSVYDPNHICQYGDNHNWHPVRNYSGRYTWIGPTRAKISLVWMLNRKIGKGGEAWKE